jgi:hypothetical protein
MADAIGPAVEVIRYREFGPDEGGDPGPVGWREVGKKDLEGRGQQLRRGATWIEAHAVAAKADGPPHLLADLIVVLEVLLKQDHIVPVGEPADRGAAIPRVIARGQPEEIVHVVRQHRDDGLRGLLRARAGSGRRSRATQRARQGRRGKRVPALRPDVR